MDTEIAASPSPSSYRVYFFQERLTVSERTPIAATRRRSTGPFLSFNEKASRGEYRLHSR